jgi:ribosome-binding factor A
MSRRQDRVSEQIHRVLGELLVFHTQDPRLTNVTVTHVDVTSDLRRATIFVMPRETDAETKATLAALTHAHKFLRHGLAGRLQLRFAPELEFAVDEASAQSEHVMNLLDQVQAPPNISGKLRRR